MDALAELSKLRGQPLHFRAVSSCFITDENCYVGCLLVWRSLRQYGIKCIDHVLRARSD